MTHDTPGETDADRRWCDHCQVSVAPADGDAGTECPACGEPL